MMDYFEIGHEFGIINRRTQAYVSGACRPWNVSYSEHVVLLTLYSHDGCTQVELGKLLTVDKALVARNVKLLEKKGLIFRRQDNEDLRYKYIYLTRKAWEMRPAMEAIVKRWVSFLLKGVEEKRLAEALDTMKIVSENAARAMVETIGTPGKGEGDEDE